jgi:hypothetical protein
MSKLTQKYLAYRATGDHSLDAILERIKPSYGEGWKVLDFGFEQAVYPEGYTYIRAER